ncbi:triphosphoribosyl-dephospho-CoA synthase [Chryseobacterium sp. JAH]|uniref:triphosphoribosyl-dephospho-CoA synthase n=1 Tax=Chryseobacterium sp. JAH TaxID=1742858 RepID=UPI0007413FF8|nr:triphosphoribosyl-dephospho-CoA synthase [Chryseobacterium sp. JAH]KUJ50018.1 hypothetical protein AR685_16650 [Chryseobacterium sp. JAH]
MLLEKNCIKEQVDSAILADLAVQALLEEVRLTPKPGLVDGENNGSHNDLTLQLMERSAYTLRSVFLEMAESVKGKNPSQEVREVLAAIGRRGEYQMLHSTGGINTHKGAIWTLGLLTAAVSILLSAPSNVQLRYENILDTAGTIAEFHDRYMPPVLTNGGKVQKRYAVRGAREEAIMGFPSLMNIAMPFMKKFEWQPRSSQRLNVLLALMATVDDTCILNRSNMETLHSVKQKCTEILDHGGMGKDTNAERYRDLDQYVTRNWISPGGSADLLAAAIFLEKIIVNYK